ncbi:MAG TPA: molybdopterin molybdotransferase MoeA [Steroidobacteraceae bacterium]|nr:molybdopterin molybdotransferase MoeA [Steroidobacteraceae bacterium]
MGVLLFVVMITPAEAEAAIRARAAALRTEIRPLHRLNQAILHEPIVAARDQPPFDRVTMDGFAFDSKIADQGRRQFAIAGTQAAGAAPLQLTSPADCIEVMTGAMLPKGCDCVVPIEKTVRAESVVRLIDEVRLEPLANIHARGSDVRTGERLLEPGTRLGPAEIAVIASNGQREARVSAEPRITVISTGDELVEPGHAITEWQIFRSNAFAVLAALQRRGFSNLNQDHLPDDLPTLRRRLQAHLESSDVVILSGGVSMGRFDYVPQVLQELGIQTVFHKVAQRPGKPFWFGVGAGKTVYALPGNPVSTLTCLVRYVFAGLDTARGAPVRRPEQIRIVQDFEVKPALALFVPAIVSFDDGARVARLAPTRGSGDFVSLLGTDGFVELPPGPTCLTAGRLVPYYSW